MLKAILTATAAAALLSVAACGDNSAEKSGENADSAIEEATQGHENLGDGPLENAGEAVDEAQENASDAVNDATDGNPSTNP